MDVMLRASQLVLIASCLTCAGCGPAAGTGAASVDGSLPASARNPISTVDQVRRMVSAQMGTEFDKVRSGTSLADLAADELDFVELIMELEDAFSILISDDVAEEMTGTADWQQGMKNVTVGKLANLVDQLKNK